MSSQYLSGCTGERSVSGQTLLKYPAVFFVGFLVTYLLTPAVRSLARRVGFLDHPDARRLHAKPVPLGGGIAVFVGFHAACAMLFLVPWEPFQSQISISWWGRFAALSALVVAIGLADDRLRIGPRHKLAGQVLVAALAYAADIRIGNVLGMHVPAYVDAALTVLWFVLLINAFNLVDGADGVAAGLTLIAALGLGVSLVIRRVPGDALLMAGLAGCCLAFLRYNFHPASIFLGDAGSMFLGFTVAALSLSTHSKGTLMAAIGVPLLAAGIPLLDTGLAVWRRSARSLLPEAGEKSPPLAGLARADMDHLHHRLIREGLSQGKVAVILYVFSAFLAGVGVLSLLFHSRALGIVIVAFVLGAYVVVRHLAWIELLDTGAAVSRGFARPSWRQRGLLLYPLTDALLLAASLLTALALVFRWHDPSYDLRVRWIDEVPLGMGFPFLALVLSRSYGRVWSLARVSDHALLGLALSVGMLAALGCRILVYGEGAHSSVLLYAVHAGLSIPILLGSRAAVRVAHDLMASATARARSGAGVKVLLYGRASRVAAYLREAELRTTGADGVPEYVVGILDDDPYVRGRRVCGLQVLGGLDDASQQIRRLGIAKLIAVDALQDPSIGKLRDLASRTGVAVQHWQVSLQPLR